MTVLLVVTLIVAVALTRRVLADHARLVLVAEAEHELRGALQGLALTDASPEFDRARVALADLAAARSGRRSAPRAEPIRLDRLVWRAAAASDLTARRAGGGVHLDWAAGAVTVNGDRGRLSQALTNLLANAIEHGGAEVRVVGRRTRRGVRVEVRDSGRGHGLKIATKAVREAGGSLTAARAGSGTAMAFELPVLDDDPATPAAGRRPGALMADPATPMAGAHPGAADADPPAAA